MSDERPTVEQLEQLPTHTVLGIHSAVLDKDFWWYRQDDGSWFLIGSLAIFFESEELLDLYPDSRIWPESIPTVLMDGLYVAGYTAALEQDESDWEYARALPNGNVFIPAGADDADLGFPVRRRKAGKWERFE